MFPDISLEILGAIVDGDKACIRWEATATHTGEGLGIAPTGRSVCFRGTTWYHIEAGNIIESWDSWNQARRLASLSS